MDLALALVPIELCNRFRRSAPDWPRFARGAGDFGVTKGRITCSTVLPIRGVAGDQQASLVGQGRLGPAGQAKCNTAPVCPFWLIRATGLCHRLDGGLDDLCSRPRSLTGPPQYAIEGRFLSRERPCSGFGTGLNAIARMKSAPWRLRRIRKTSRSLVPCFTGRALMRARAARDLLGLTVATSVADLARATLEGVAFQVRPT